MNKLIDALHCRNQGRPPIWLMRQAGRYLPSYQKLKKGRSLLDMFHHPETITEVTLLPIEELGFDGAILFSDILTVFDGLRISYDFHEEKGPVVLTPPDQIALVDPEEAYPHIKSAIHMLRPLLKVPLLGFAGAPFTVASYLIEGGTSRDLKKTKLSLFSEPKKFQTLLDIITEATIAYLHLQIDAGVEAIQLFDSWANNLGYEEFNLYSLAPMRKITKAIQERKIPVILFCRGSCFFAQELAELAPQAISLDWSGHLPTIRKVISPQIALQGNLDPALLCAPKEIIAQKTERLLSEMENEPGYIFNLGHGILPHTPIENVHYLVQYVQNRS